MGGLSDRGILAAVLVGVGLSGTAPAFGFEIFGIRLWGEAEDEGRIEVIDPLPYTVTLRVTGDDLQTRLENASALWTDREQPASGKAGLLAKSRGDYRRILAALYGAGYYGGQISIRAAGQEVADLTLGADFPAEVPIVIEVDPGPEFRFGVTEFINAPRFTDSRDDAVEEPETVGFARGEPARARVVGAAVGLAVEQWQQYGYPKAAEAEREVIADHPASQLDVTVRLDPGRRAQYGPVRVSGSRRVDTEFTAFMVDLQRGKEFDPDDVEAARARLNRLDVFRSIRIEEADTIGPDGTLPMTVVVEDRKPRTIGFGGTLSTIDGIGLEAYWLHRNLFGRAEKLRFSANIDGLGQSTDPDDLDYSLGVTFTKPGVHTPDTDFVIALEARQLDYDTYRERSITGRVGLSQQFGDDLTGELYVEASRSRFEDNFGVRNFTTIGLLGRGAYDRRRIDPLNAVSGYYLAAEAEPFYEAEFGNFAVRGTLEGRVYYALDAEERFVLAGRAKVGSFLGADIEESPPDLLFFAGGGGSVRGYEYRSIGVEVSNPDGEPGIVGGRGLFETSAELRTRINESFGAVAFVDAGFVAEDPQLTGSNELRAGAGLGLRYFTAIGALRADLAAPINPRPDDPAVALYIGIGQSF